MGEKLGIGVIGVGTFGSLHAKIYSELDTCELHAVADINAERSSQVSAAFGAQGYSDYRQLLERDDIGAVSICTTGDLHIAPAVAAVEAGKHVFVEKPLALTPEGCDRIIDAASSAGVTLTVGHVLRFDPRYVTAYQEIQKGAIGEPVHIFTRRNNVMASAQRLRKHSSVLFFLGIHDIDFVNWCMGVKPETVYGVAVSKVLGDTPDTVLALMTFPDGTIASLEASWILPETLPGTLDARFDVVGTNGALYVNGGAGAVSIASERFTQPGISYAPDLFGESVGILRDELAHFVKCATEGIPPIVSGEDGKRAVEVAYAIQKSLDSGDVVQVA